MCEGTIEHHHLEREQSDPTLRRHDLQHREAPVMKRALPGDADIVERHGPALVMLAGILVFVMAWVAAHA